MTDIAASRKRAKNLADSDATRQLQEIRVQQGKVAILAEFALYYQRKAALLGYTGGGKRATVFVDRQVLVEKVDDVTSQMEVDVTLSTQKDAQLMEWSLLGQLVSWGVRCSLWP